MSILIQWIVRALVILATAYLVPGFHVYSLMGAMVLVLILSFLNLLVKPVLLLLTLPINILTLGLFTIIINALVLQLAINLVPGVSSDSFTVTLIASLIMSLLSLIVGKLNK
jgi:putative membrane protein